MTFMASYDTFYKFYDAIMGNRAEATERLRKLIRKAHPHAKTVLELGCGTGSVLKRLAKDYEVTGLDLSRKMLAIAKRKTPKARLYHRDMVRFRLPQQFDVICCVFDSINHVLSFTGWKNMFANVQRHLAEGGVFIFDINTQKALDRHIAGPPWVHRFGHNLLIMDITGAQRNISNWNIKVFEQATGNKYLLHEEDIQEASFPVRDIVRALRAHFRRVETTDPNGKRPSSKSERVYFVCRK
jgi:predicted TPR repeat methyltransferase